MLWVVVSAEKRTLMGKSQEKRIFGEEPSRNAVNDTPTRKFYTSFDAKSKVLKIR